MLECFKVQETLRKLCVDDLGSLQVKLEEQQTPEIVSGSVIKFEVTEDNIYYYRVQCGG